MAAILLFFFCQMMGFSCSSITILYFFLFFSFFLIMVYLHTDIQWEETSVQSFWFRSLSVSPRGMLSTEKKSLRFKGQSAVLSLQYSFILYIWCCHLSHLLGLSHLQVLSLSSSWRSLQYSSVCLQEHRQVAGSCTNKRFLFSEQ